MVHKFSLLVLKHGAKGILPHNLPQKELFYLLKTAYDIIDDKEVKNEKTSCITFCVITILNHQQNTTEITATCDDMAKYIKMYSFSIAFEASRRESPNPNNKKPTLENIFDEERFAEIKRNAFSEEYLEGVAVDSEWVN